MHTIHHCEGGAQVIDVAFGPGSFLWLADVRLSRAQESQRNETKEWDGDNGCYTSNWVYGVNIVGSLL